MDVWLVAGISFLIGYILGGLMIWLEHQYKEKKNLQKELKEKEVSEKSRMLEEKEQASRDDYLESKLSLTEGGLLDD